MTTPVEIPINHTSVEHLDGLPVLLHLSMNRNDELRFVIQRMLNAIRLRNYDLAKTIGKEALRD